MNTIIVSDLHIGSRFFCSRDFERFIETIPQDHTLILNGDIIDQPYAKLGFADRHILDLIRQLAGSRQVIWIRGNHDNGFMPDSFGRVRFKHLHAIGRRLLITHGDDFDEIMPRNQAFMKAFKMLHRLRVRLGAKPVHVAEYAKKWEFFYRVLRKNVMTNAIKCALDNSYAAVACGHTHFAENLVFNGIRYINTGAWTESPCHYLQVTAQAMLLKKFGDDPITAKKSEAERATSSLSPHLRGKKMPAAAAAGIMRPGA